MKENLPNLTKEIDIQVQEAESQRSWTQGGHTKAHHKMPKVKERILKAAREKQRVTYKSVPIRLSADSQKKLGRLEGTGKRYRK